MILHSKSRRQPSWSSRLVVATAAVAVLPLSPFLLWGDQTETLAGSSKSEQADCEPAEDQALSASAERSVSEETPAHTRQRPSNAAGQDAHLEAVAEIRTAVATETHQAAAAVRQKRLDLAKAEAKLTNLRKGLDALTEYAPDVTGKTDRQAEARRRLLDVNFNRRIAAQRELEAAEAAFDDDSGELGRLLDAQRRACEADGDYFRALADTVDVSALGENGERFKARFVAPRKLDALRQGRDRALSVWRELTQEGPTAQEAMARQQYFLFCSTLKRM